ncbi:hypothetical protein [Kocuria sp. HSID16901]|uniref:hypothetical protein n=1 Tax=Kocuria sp. HSID16901 TaxID=2419505 RepID=UPI000660C67E|nr:hypothetical protein [Kocuria sp. HSID16901]MCT1367207.1 hypothetical protein [Rothia sp. p3-SID1597]RUQ23492.1 hypothetical protein D8M21_01975 [Kocuria sp. HSID16901]
MRLVSVEEFEENTVEDLVSDLPDRLYKVEVIGGGPVPERTLANFAARYPEQKEFFYPSARRVYRSVSAARARADLLRDCGCDVTVYECTPDWAVCETKQERIARLEAENAELRASLGLDGAA